MPRHRPNPDPTPMTPRKFCLTKLASRWLNSYWPSDSPKRKGNSGGEGEGGNVDVKVKEGESSFSSFFTLDEED
jgi:hypothetical protein